MPRIQPINAQTADAPAASLLENVRKQMGSVPNLISTMANSPAVAKAYLGMSGALAGGGLPTPLREQLALTVGEANGCDYCLAAHTMLGKAAGLTDEAALDARRASADEPKAQAALTLARQIMETRGHVSDDDLQAARDAGLTDGDIAEVVAHVALNIFTNYFNHVAQTQVDFPAAPALAAA